MNKTEVLNVLHKNGFQFYGLEEGFDKFDSGYKGRGTTDVKDTPRFEKFEWVSEDGNAVSVDIAIQHREIGEDEFEFEYLLDYWEPPIPDKECPKICKHCPDNDFCNCEPYSHACHEVSENEYPE